MCRRQSDVSFFTSALSEDEIYPGGDVTIAEIAQRLHGRKSGAEWSALCPAHDDHNPSLSLKETKDGRILAKCHAGCEQRAVIAALKARGLWPGARRSDRRAIAAVYDYTDEAGQVLYQVVRTEPKGFYQRRSDGQGGWTNKKCKCQVLYRLREVLEAAVVFVVEGEKDAESLRARGFVATTNAGGAKAPWLPSFTEALRGREVILIPDNDNPGRQRVLTIARALLGHAAQIIVLELEDAKDVSDWFDRGHGELELISQVHGPEVRQ
jgi:putative DNA primase/helicase